MIMELSFSSQHPTAKRYNKNVVPGRQTLPVRAPLCCEIRVAKVYHLITFYKNAEQDKLDWLSLIEPE